VAVADDIVVLVVALVVPPPMNAIAAVVFLNAPEPAFTPIGVVGRTAGNTRFSVVVVASNQLGVFNVVVDQSSNNDHALVPSIVSDVVQY
jgi:hypothetical protein